MHQVVAILIFLSYSFMSFIQEEPCLYGNRISYKYNINFRKRISWKSSYYYVCQPIIRPTATNTLTISGSTSSTGTVKMLNTSKPVVRVNKFIELDLSESRSSQYIRDTSHTILKDYANEKMCFTWLLGDYEQDLPVSHYKVKRSMVWIVFIPRYNRLYCQELRFHKDCMQ